MSNVIGSRIVGFETDPHYTYKDPSNAWVICDGLPVLIATDKLRPCTAAELLAYTYMNDQVRQPISETATQQAFIDERHEQPAKRARSTAVADPGPSAAAASSSSAAAAEPLYEPTSEEDDEMTLPEDSSKELRAKHSSKELRAALPKKRDNESEGSDTQSLSSHWKKTKTTGKGTKMIEKLAMMFDCDNEDNFQRSGFIQVRLAGPKIKKKSRPPPRKKDGDKNLRYSNCTPDIQAGLRKSRVTEWQKWKQLNAGVILTKEVQELRDEGVTLQPMQWVETDKIAHKRRDGVHVDPLLKGRLVGCGNFEDQEGLRKDSPAGDVVI